MDDVNNRGLAGSVFIQADGDAYEAAKSVLELMNLPDAPENAHLSMPNSNRIYLNDAGLVLSFVYDHRSVFNRVASWTGLAEPESTPVFLASQIKTDLVLQPIFTKRLSDRCWMEIVPGIPKATVTPEDMKHYAGLLDAEGIRFINPHAEIMGEIRHPNGGRHLVVSNRRRIGLKDKSFLPGKGSPIQSEIYGELAVAFERAFENKDPAKVQAVLAYCERINALPEGHPGKILYTPWSAAGRHNTVREQEVHAVASQYAHLRHKL